MRATTGFTMVFLMFVTAGCSTAPRSLAERRGLVDEAEAAVDMMVAKDPSLRGVIDRSVGFAVYPDVGTAGAVVGGAYGRGVLFERGRPIGFTELNQGAVGAIIGGQTYSQLVVFHEDAALNRLKAGNFDIGAEASAVLLKAGVAAATRAEGGFSIFQVPKGGLMAAVAVTGQKINYQPMHRSYEVEGAVTTGGSKRANGSSGNDVAGGKDGTSGQASAYQVDQNLPPHDQIKLRTGEAALENARESGDNQEK